MYALAPKGEKGADGEYEVAHLLNTLPESKYIKFNDILVPTSYGTTQIDHVLISIYGVFVIETKNYSGEIYGGQYSEKWSEVVNGRKYHFRNPLKQNYAHVMAIMDILKIPYENIISIVVFSDFADINVKAPKIIINFAELKECILSYQRQIFTENEIDEMTDILDKAIIKKDDYSRDKHVEEIRKRTNKDKFLIEARICPKCNGDLVLRKGRYGSFYGCSNYPKCKYVIKPSEIE